MLNLEERAQKHLNQSLTDSSPQEVYQLLFDLVKEKAARMPTHDTKRKMYYVSSEFLIGKLLSNNLLNLGIYDEVKEELATHGLSLDEVEEAEQEPSLGNGGLGRLAACFLDSTATLGLNGDGIGLNYHFGLFRQLFQNNQQKYRPDEWLGEPTWLNKTDTHFQVPFGKFTLESSLYEIDILGYHQGTKNKLRLFDLESVTGDIIEENTIKFDKENIKENLTLFLYPDDSDREGYLLRIYQQYFMVSNAAQLIIQEAVERGSNIHDLAEYAIIQINDTHPAFIIPELVRLLVYKHDIAFAESIEIIRQTVAFTNHTILSEALEKWPMDYIQEVAPEIAHIIQRLDQVIKEEYPHDYAVHIIDGNQVVHMAHIAIHFGFSVNGVSALHTSILKETELREFYQIYPEKFNNKTNGITFRRWLMASNPALAELIDENIGTDWHEDADLTGLLDQLNNPDGFKALQEIKQSNKVRLSDHLKRTKDVVINPDSIIDIHIKRIHEYKRQQMLALYIIYKYKEIKKGNIPETPITIIYGGKAAPAYTIAQDIIHLILTLSELIANDPAVSPHLQVEFIENYNVSEAEFLIPAANISEQISLASKEASGTGNMKFMLNGALTIATYDGANVEIAELVGEDNIYTFGKSSDEIVRIYEEGSYNAEGLYYNDKLKPLVDFIISDEMMALGNEENLHRLHHDIISKDYFMALIDLEEFIQLKEKVYADYEDRDEWTRKSLVNIAKAGFFSSDRTIKQYNEDIWKLED